MRRQDGLTVSELRDRAGALRALAAPCRLCPNECASDRLHGMCGRCRTGFGPRIASYGPHFGEEATLVGQGGSGTVFFSGCNLSCAFCQNWRISQQAEGFEVRPEALAAVFLSLQSLGCHNLNLVTPTHQAHAIVDALATAVEEGFGLPVVWNCGGYESAEVLSLLDGIVDIYMPDLKYGDDATALRMSGVQNYVSFSRSAIREMHRQVGDLVTDGAGVAAHGLLVRHLVLPDRAAGTQAVVRFLAEAVSPDTYVNLMDQYRPAHRAEEFPELGRTISRHEYEEAQAWAREAGLHRFAS